MTFEEYMAMTPDELKANRLTGWEKDWNENQTKPIIEQTLTYDQYLQIYDRAYGTNTRAALEGSPLYNQLTGGGGAAGGNVRDYLGDPYFWQGLFEKEMGIPTAGRGTFANWLANQWQAPAAEYALQAAGLGGAPSTQTFNEWLASRQGQPTRMGGSQLRALTALTPTAQTSMLENLPSYVPQEAFYGGLREKYPAWLASGLLQQAFAPKVQRQFAITPEQAQVEPTNTFLQYLRGRYGL